MKSEASRTSRRRFIVRQNRWALSNFTESQHTVFITLLNLQLLSPASRKALAIPVPLYKISTASKQKVWSSDYNYKAVLISSTPRIHPQLRQTSSALVNRAFFPNTGHQYSLLYLAQARLSLHSLTNVPLLIWVTFLFQPARNEVSLQWCRLPFHASHWSLSNGRTCPWVARGNLFLRLENGSAVAMSPFRHGRQEGGRWLPGSLSSSPLLKTNQALWESELQSIYTHGNSVINASIFLPQHKAWSEDKCICWTV